jgi:signal transduction histidine kinase
MLKEDLKTLTTDEKTEMIDDIIHETERSQRIVRELLNFARENKTDIKPLKIEEIMSDSIRLVANQVRLAKVSISLDFVKDLPPIHGDEQMLKQVFVNLILNAVDVLPPQGAIAISIHKQGKPGFITVDISDNGPGIPEHIQTRIFEPFFTTKSMGKGVGLGLSVSRGIIRKLGGYISFKSSAGKGTTFTVSFPTTDVPSIIMSEKADETE